MTLKIKNLFNPPKRIVKETYRDLNVKYRCQKQNVFGKWVTMKYYNKDLYIYRYCVFSSLIEAQVQIGIDLNPVITSQIMGEKR